MSWWIILIIVICTTILILLTTLIILIKKNKQKKLLTIIKDINDLYGNLKLKKIAIKQLPVSVEDIKEDIYYSDKVILGKYENLNKINGQNIFLKTEYSIGKKGNKTIFLRYKIRDINFIKSSDFIPLNQTDLLISQRNLYFIDSFESQIIPLVDVNSITFFWEKNNYIKNKRKYIGIEINTQDKRLLFLFTKYQEAIIFVVHVICLG